MRSRLKKTAFVAEKNSFIEMSAAIGEETWSELVALHSQKPQNVEPKTSTSDKMNKSFVFKQKPDRREVDEQLEEDPTAEEETSPFEKKTRYLGGPEDDELRERVQERQQVAKNDLVRLKQERKNATRRLERV